MSGARVFKSARCVCTLQVPKLGAEIAQTLSTAQDTVPQEISGEMSRE